MIRNANINYHFYRSLIKQAYDGDLVLDLDDLSEEIYEAYFDDRLDSRQYDNLCCLLNE